LFAVSQQIEKLAGAADGALHPQAFALATTVPALQQRTDAVLRDWLATQGLSLEV
jgi:hypothetical protein